MHLLFVEEHAKNTELLVVLITGQSCTGQNTKIVLTPLLRKVLI